MVVMAEDESRTGDSITVGDITNAQGVAVGRHASATVTGNNISGAKVDAAQMRAVLESLYDELEKTGLPKKEARSVQTAAGNALEAVNDKEVNANVVADNVKKIAETMKEAKVAVEEGSSLWKSIKELAPLLGPLVGGAHVVASWFGLPF
jgi:hypothetical protein